MTKSKTKPARHSSLLRASLAGLPLALAIALSACSSPSPATSSSSHWATCNTMVDCANVSGAAACTGGYCVDSSGQKIESPGTTPTSCDPLAPHELPVTLGTVLGVGRDSAGTLYLADEIAGSPVIHRVFVSSGDTLFRKRVAGSGSSGGGADADYNFGFEEGFDAATARSLLIERRGGVTVAMGLGHDPKAFIGSPGAVDEPLTVVDESTISPFKLRNLPGTVTITYVADVANGKVIVVTQPTDDSTYEDSRLFYGTEDAMVERKVDSVTRARDGGSTDIRFTVDGAQYSVHFSRSITPTDGGIAVHIGPGTLDTGSGSPIDVTERQPVPTTLPGFSFTCS